MGTDRKNIVGKVAKLLALAKSANVHEAEAALTRARQLMAEYHITEAEAAQQGAPGAPFSMGKAMIEGRQLQPWKKRLAQVISEACGCTLIRRTCGRTYEGMIPLGTETDLELAFTIFNWSLLEVTRLGRLNTMGRTDLFRRSWHIGAVDGLHTALERAKAEEEKTAPPFALVHLEKREVELESFRLDHVTDPHAAPRKPRETELDSKAYLHGHHTGSRIKVPGTPALAPSIAG